MPFGASEGLMLESSSPSMARVAQAPSLAGFGKITGLTASQPATSAASRGRRVHTGTSTNGVLAHRDHALHGLEWRANIHRRNAANRVEGPMAP
jgi:hypothetical protein